MKDDRDPNKLSGLDRLLHYTNVFNHPVELRAFVKWWFELIRNLVIVGGVQYLGVKTNSFLLKGVAGVSLGFIVLSLLSYVSAFVWSSWNFTKYPRTGKVADLTLNTFLFIVLYFTLHSSVSFFVFAVTNAQLQE